MKNLDYFVKRKIQINELKLNNVPQDFIDREKLSFYEEILEEIYIDPADDRFTRQVLELIFESGV